MLPLLDYHLTDTFKMTEPIVSDRIEDIAEKLETVDERSILKATRRALLVGINYKSLPEKGMHLNGCVNDSRNIFQFLLQQEKQLAPAAAFSPLEILLLTDEPVAADLDAGLNGRVVVLQQRDMPTRANIQRGLQWLVQGATAQSRLFFAYSGHGSYVRDVSGDEADKKDECLVPLDCNTAGMITDDDLRARIAEALPRGAQLFSLIDACHSATMFDLRVQVQDVSTLTAASSTAPLAASAAAKKIYVKSQWRRTQKRTVVGEKVKSNAHIVTLSGCRDPQTSADAFVAGSYTGALSFAFLRALNAEKNGSLFDIFQHTSVWLKLNGYEQQPVLSFGSEETESLLADRAGFSLLQN